MKTRSMIGYCVVACALLLAGCTHVETSPALSDTDPKLAMQAHWIAQPANASVTTAGYDKLWDACIQTARWRGFTVDRLDYRSGLMISKPLVSKQIFEFWRRDVSSMEGMTESTLATVSRTVRFEISKREDGTFECVPKVLVQRFSSAEKRITSVTRYRESFDIREGAGNRERDKGKYLPDTYWHTTGRDADLEKVLADGVRSRLSA